MEYRGALGQDSLMSVSDYTCSYSSSMWNMEERRWHESKSKAGFFKIFIRSSNHSSISYKNTKITLNKTDKASECQLFVFSFIVMHFCAKEFFLFPYLAFSLPGINMSFLSWRYLNISFYKKNNV